MTNDYYTTLGERIKKIRESKGLTQSDLAQELNCSEKSVSLWECGKISGIKLENLLKICKVLDCDLSYLTRKSDYTTKEKKLASEVTGLSEEAIENISKFLSGYDYVSFSDFVANIDEYWDMDNVRDSSGRELGRDEILENDTWLQQMYEIYLRGLRTEINSLLECPDFFPVMEHIIKYLDYDKKSQTIFNDKISLQDAELKKYKEREAIEQSIAALKSSKLYSKIFGGYVSGFSVDLSNQTPLTTAALA